MKLEIEVTARRQKRKKDDDTQVAAAFLGLPPQVGYADLVARQLGHSIDKGQTRTDWSRRPLSPAQIAYAADDVRHLLGEQVRGLPLAFISPLETDDDGSGH